MKKIYLIATTMVFGSVAFGQIHKNLPVEESYEVPGVQTDKVVSAPLYNFGKAPGDAIFTEDFDGDMGGFTVQAGTMDTIWKFDTNGPDGQYSANTQIIGSTTASNGFMIYDADLSNPGNPPFVNRVGKLTSPAVDLTGYSNVILSYDSRYRTCCSGLFFLKLLVSTDDFATADTFNVSNINGSTNNDLGTFRTKLNLTDYLGTATNLSNFKFSFYFDGNTGGGNTSHYHWQVDDIAIYENWTDDNHFIEHFMEAGALGIPYYRMTVNQISPITFGGAIRNDGIAVSAGTTLTTTISTGGTGTVSSTPYAAAVGATDTVFTTAWTPTATSPVTLDFSHEISATNADENMSDNIITDAMNITTSVYGVDNGTNGGSFSQIGSQNLGDDISVGNIMEIINDDYITSVSIDVSSNASNVGQFIKGLIYKWDANAQEYFYFTETDQVEIGANGNNNNSTITIPIAGGPIQIFAGDDLLVMQNNPGSFAGGTGSNVVVRTAQRVANGIVAGVNGAQTVYTLTNPRAIRVRLNLNPSASLDEANENITVANLSPNPTNGITKLNFTSRVNQEVSIQVVDVTGKVMQTEALGAVAAGGHTVDINSAEFNAGIYFVNIVSNDGVVTKKLIKK